MGLGHDLFAPIGICPQLKGQGCEVWKNIEHGGPLIGGALQHPAGRAEMSVGDQSVIDKTLCTFCAQNGRGVDQMDVVKGLNEISEREICLAKAIAMAVSPPLGKAQGLNGRFGKSVQ